MAQFSDYKIEFSDHKIEISVSFVLMRQPTVFYSVQNRLSRVEITTTHHIPENPATSTYENHLQNP